MTDREVLRYTHYVVYISGSLEFFCTFLLQKIVQLFFTLTFTLFG